MVKNKYSTNITLDENNSLTYIIDHIEPGSTVLEFGPATGYMTKYLKETKNCSVYIIEIDDAAFHEAVKYAVDGFCGDAETGSWVEQFKDISFDYITFADVLEHLRNPLEVLKKAAGLLKKDIGKVLISIPNTAHNAVLVDLYNNKFQYRNTGIMDNTHLRFFTHDSVVDMFREAGLYPVDEDQVVFDLEYAGFSNKPTDVPDSVWAALRLRKYGYVNQFLFTLSTNSTSELECTYHDEPTDEEECSVYYSAADTYDEEHKAIDFVKISNDEFQIHIDFNEVISAQRLMIHTIPFPCCIGDLKLSIDSSATEKIIPDNGYEENHKYIFIDNSARLEVVLKDVTEVKSLNVSGHLYPITFAELNGCLVRKQKSTLALISSLNKIVASKDILLQQSGAEIQRLNTVVEEKQNIIHEMSAKQTELNETLNTVNTEAGILSTEKDRLNNVIAEKDAALGDAGEEQTRLNETLDITNKSVEAYAEDNKRLNNLIVEKDALLQKSGQEEVRLNKVVEEKLDIIHDMSAEIQRLNKVVEEKMQVIADLQKKIGGAVDENGSETED